MDSYSDKKEKKIENFERNTISWSSCFLILLILIIVLLWKRKSLFISAACETGRLYDCNANALFTPTAGVIALPPQQGGFW